MLKSKDFPPLTLMSPNAPMNAINTPMALNHLTLRLKKATPMSIVNNGVRELSIPARELSIPFWANAKRNAGIPLPVTDDRNRNFQSLQESCFILVKANGRRTRNAITIRKAPTSIPEKYISPFLIRMNEVPQITASMIRIVQDNDFILLSCWIDIIEMNLHLTNIG